MVYDRSGSYMVPVQKTDECARLQSQKDHVSMPINAVHEMQCSNVKPGIEQIEACKVQNRDTP